MSIQMEVIKKAYHQESECEGVEVSPREVGHNIYILAQQVRLFFSLKSSLQTLPLCRLTFNKLMFCVEPFLLGVCLAAGQTQQDPAESSETS